jgi:hypothetical protein
MAIIDKRAEPDIAKRCILRALVATTQAERDDWLEAALVIERWRRLKPLRKPASSADLPAASSASHYSG